MSSGSRSAVALRVSVVDANGRPVRARSLASWLARIAPGRARGGVTIALVSDRRIRRLNSAYRGIDRATDVLSFPAASGPADAGPHQRNRNSLRHLGDIVIARGVADRQARRARHSRVVEWRTLALHGLLHLLGYDHERDDGRMARLERRLRRKGKLPGSLTERGAGA
jgi:probable rRNA maturation factor